MPLGGRLCETGVGVGTAGQREAQRHAQLDVGGILALQLAAHGDGARVVGERIAPGAELCLRRRETIVVGRQLELQVVVRRIGGGHRLVDGERAFELAHGVRAVPGGIQHLGDLREADGHVVPRGDVGRVGSG